MPGPPCRGWSGPPQQVLMSAEPRAFLRFRTPRRRRCANSPPPKSLTTLHLVMFSLSFVQQRLSAFVGQAQTGLQAERPADQPRTTSPSLPQAQQTGRFATNSRPLWHPPLACHSDQTPSSSKLLKRIPGAPFSLSSGSLSLFCLLFKNALYWWES